MPVFAAALKFEAPGTLAPGDALCDALFHQPVERTVKGDTVVRNVGCRQRGANLVMREGVLPGQQGLDDRDAGACDATTACGDQVAGRDGKEGSLRLVWHCSVESDRLLMQHCSI